jgi:hypothetical protein
MDGRVDGLHVRNEGANQEVTLAGHAGANLRPRLPAYLVRELRQALDVCHEPPAVLL